MLNRKVSNYLYYGILILIVGTVLLIRSITLGNINAKITQLEESNISLQKTNDDLEKSVEEYKDIQINHLYELYGQVPNYYSQTELTHYTFAMLEVIGINESVDFQREVDPDSEVTFTDGTTFKQLQEDFKIVEVQVYFTTMDDSVIEEFIDLLFNSEQVFIVSSIEYYSPDGINYIGVKINFLAFYKLEDAS